MASSTTTPPSNEQQTFPILHLSTINVSNFVSSKLRGDKILNNYSSWKEQMLCLIESQDLLQFIEGKIDDVSEAHIIIKRTDRLVKGWILGALDDDVLKNVANFTTATDVWLVLEKMFSDPGQVPQEQNNEVQGNDLIEYVPLHKAALQGDWEAAKRFIVRDPGVVINDSNMTPLHVAVGTENSVHLVQKMVEMMPDDAIARISNTGDTALHIAACVGNIRAASILVNRMPTLLYVPTYNGQISIFPIQAAAIYAQKRMVKYLISVTTEQIAYEGMAGLGLLISLIQAEFFDIALDLVIKYPYLAKLKLTNGASALSKLADQNKALFQGESCFAFWERFIPIRCTKLEKQMMINQQAQSLVKCLCKQMDSMSYMEAADISHNAIFTAAVVGNNHLVEMVIEAYPNALYICTAENRSLFHVAVENRSEGVFNLLYQMGTYKHRCVNFVDNYGNTMLHAAGILGPSHKLNQISGAALQMQRELQWYKEVEKVVLPEYKDRINNVNKTPRMLFTDTHKQLKEEGEKWMKDTSASCTIAAALIATVMFAAAITVPGGNESTTGFPMFSKDIEFIVFGISNAVSLFTSSTSLLIFLSILTSRYAEEDFLYALPKRLIIGLGTLFLSVTFMMVGFSVTICLVFGQKKAWVLIPVAALACLPVTSFVLLQYPLLVDLISSTYGRGIFGKQSNRPFNG